MIVLKPAHCKPVPHSPAESPAMIRKSEVSQMQSMQRLGKSSPAQSRRVPRYLAFSAREVSVVHTCRTYAHVHAYVRDIYSAQWEVPRDYAGLRGTPAQWSTPQIGIVPYAPAHAAHVGAYGVRAQSTKRGPTRRRDAHVAHRGFTGPPRAKSFAEARGNKRNWDHTFFRLSELFADRI
jgi:hypothetical protein